jgi:hypothetical protein
VIKPGGQNQNGIVPTSSLCLPIARAASRRVARVLNQEALGYAQQDPSIQSAVSRAMVGFRPDCST